MLPHANEFEHQLDGKNIELVTLDNGKGMIVNLCNYGSPNREYPGTGQENNPVDVVLGFNSIGAYFDADEPYHGVTVGRFANRICGGRFMLDAHEFVIKPNNGPNALHGGAGGFDKKVWGVNIIDQQTVYFHYRSEDGEEGFPGNLSVTVRFRLTDDNNLVMTYLAETDKPTVVNLTNHAFFNLNGEGNGTVLEHVARIHADQYLPVDVNQIPTGAPNIVAGTPFDFRTEKPIGRDITLDHEQLIGGNGGYDHNYVLEHSVTNGETPAACVFSPKTGISLEVLTTEPGLQLYTGNFLSGKDIGKQGTPYGKYGAFCLESQHFPDTPNRPEYPSTLLTPGEVFKSETTYRFSTVS